MRVTTEDITVAWEQPPHPLDSQYGKWRMAVFQDVQESIDGSKLYFLYDSQADEQSGTSGQRKGYPGLVIFDTNFKCFVGEISIHTPGKMKFLFALKCPSPQGGSSFVLVTEEHIYGQIRLNVSRVDLSHDGLSIANVRPLIPEALTIGGEYICSMRDDLPEIVVMANPGLQIWRINCMTESPQPPVATFRVPGSADLNHFYDGFLNNGNIIFLSATPDGHFDNTRVHLLSLNNPQHITSQNCTGDPQRGMPIPRKQCGFDSVSNAILMAGGEVDRGNGFERLVDYWALNTQTFQWLQIPSQMPCPLIEPRLTACHSGNIFVWGDFDQPLPRMPPHGTHLRILRVSGLETVSRQPPVYSSFAPPAYPSVDNKSGGTNPPYPSDTYGNQGGGEPALPYPCYKGQPEFDPNQEGGYTQTSDGQNAYYPKKKKKSCSIQ
ncbi:hypothetical protein CRE_14294 [Caenorhabditis remanei]|uniref:Uncharacterized protein n=1 Tax=Caenorhabditis remanei TaxID=31234 RepID=E3NBV3_CAERE|nr:hypothetical protein CRE_14294 [Caenorhabditis remanei]